MPNDPNTLAPGLSPSAQQRARQIVDAASRVMCRKGYGGTTMKDIAAEAGIAPGLIHYYFDSKEDLLLAVARSLCDQMRREAEEAFAAAGEQPPIARAYAALEATKSHLAMPDQQRLLMETFSLSLAEPRMRQQFIALYEDLIETTSAMVEQVNRQVPTPLPVPVHDYASVIVATIDGLAMQKLLDPTRDEHALYRAFAFIMLSSLASSYALAGLPLPSLEDFAALLGGPQP